MDDEIDTLMIDVRAATEGFRADVDGMRAMVDRQLMDGFARAGNVLERGLVSAVRRGSLGFEDLRRTAIRALDDIAANALKIGIGSALGSGPASQGLAPLITGALSGLLGLPGRATGGPVSPHRPIMVGERGPEVFVPTGAGRVETLGEGARRDVRVSINLPRSQGAEAPVALRRSARQIASLVRRAMRDS